MNQVKNAIQKLITPLKASGPVVTNGIALTAKNDAKVTQPHQMTNCPDQLLLPLVPHEHDAYRGDL